MNPDKANTTQERETETPFAEKSQGGEKTLNQDGMDQNESNRGSGQGQNQGGRSQDQRNDEDNKGTNGLNR